MVSLTTLKRWDGTAMVDLTVAKRWDGTAFVDCLALGGTTLSATASPGTASGFVFQNEPAPNVQAVYTNSVVVTPTGGTGPYTHAWTKVSGSSAILPTVPTGATTAFYANSSKNTYKAAVYRDTITDSLGATTTVDVPADVEYATDL